MTTNKSKYGFTLIEVLVVISIIGVLLGLSVFSLQTSKKSGRDAKRKSDLELIRSGIEMYRADCGRYPTSSELVSPLKGHGETNSCPSDNEYINNVPEDSQDPIRTYKYSSDGITYKICCSLENDTGASVTCGGNSNCGETCNYRVENP